MRAEETPQHFVDIAKKQVAQERPTGQVVERTQDFILLFQELLVSSKFQSGTRCVCSNAPPSPRSAASNASTSRSSTCPLRIGRRRSLALLGSLSRPRAKISCRRRLCEKLPPESRSASPANRAKCEIQLRQRDGASLGVTLDVHTG